LTRRTPPPPHPATTLFPYTTLFRSGGRGIHVAHGGVRGRPVREDVPEETRRVIVRGRVELVVVPHLVRRGPDPRTHAAAVGADRSEEHTSELQSRFDLVCRLLLEKK